MAEAPSAADLDRWRQLADIGNRRTLYNVNRSGEYSRDQDAEQVLDAFPEAVAAVVALTEHADTLQREPDEATAMLGRVLNQGADAVARASAAEAAQQNALAALGQFRNWIKSADPRNLINALDVLDNCLAHFDITPEDAGNAVAVLDTKETNHHD